ncbi:hypothetical protein EPA93_44080 [Ktedonosporobacter rubrisoli]|uniref:Uncharacterized protein n=1 Tax=Ktedonosporobacter rubrisoli TaxID=2509675 RepID=A0A4P6K437_KTERU|nr:hypothetical protein [Ktedonosporobacter rubrisoli]QBD82580.1 hypothetical protein EPA93_44080 [Ktedonosporobacter rubrisoli]
MVFCGQCGLQLASGQTRCPRCGTSIESELTDPHLIDPDNAPNAPTTASPSLLVRKPASQTPAYPTNTFPSGQQKLVLRPGPENNAQAYNPQEAFGATSSIDRTNYATGMPPANPRYQNMEGDYASQAGYPAYPPAMPNYPAPADPYQAAPMQYQEPPSRKGRSTALVLILLGLVLILGTMGWFVLRQQGIIGNSPSNNSAIGNNGTQPDNNNANTPTITISPTPAASPTVEATAPPQAKQVIEQYYAFINQHNYRSAYNLLSDTAKTQQSFADFRNGYKNTREDTVTFGTITTQTDGTVKVPVTIQASEKAPSGGLKQTIYTGNYIVAQQNNGTWKIEEGQLSSGS